MDASSTGRSEGHRLELLIDAESSSDHGVHHPGVSNHNLNINDIYGTVGVLNNFNSVTHSTIYGDPLKESDAIQIKVSAILNPRDVAQAVYGAQINKGCMENTRVQILREIEAWVKDLKGPQIFWLSGMAGTGKSAIAWTVCARANDDQDIVLGGSFFCSRSTGLSTQRDVRCVIPTLAQLMARQSARFAEALAAELAVDPNVLHQQIGVQVEKLLYKPLLALKDSPSPIVFVIDALDECGGHLADNGMLDDAEIHRIVSDMLEALVTISRSDIKLPVKFFVTSRPETHIRNTHVSDATFSKVLRLHTVDKQQVTADIRLYISNKLFATPELRALFNENDVNALVQFCDGLFIVAAVALQHALGEGTDVATARFKSLLNASRDRLSIGAAAPLDRMYAVIVEDAAKADEVETQKLGNLLRLLAALLSARMALSVTALADLMVLPGGQLRARLSRLHAVIHVPDDDDDASLRPLHASFGDYLFGRASTRIRIPEWLGHNILAHGSLHALEKRLYFNISQSRSSLEPTSTAKPESITLSLEYACTQWIYHISTLLELYKTGRSTKGLLRSRFLSWISRTPQESHQLTLDKKINSVFRPRLLFWLEVMVVIGQIQRAAAMLMFAAATVRTKELSRFLRDANSFVASSQQAISRSAPHIYLSALPFADKHALIYQEFAPLCTGLITVDLIGISDHAGRLVMTLTGHDGPVNSVAYSPDSRILASASADGTIRIWDMRTGEEMMTPLHSGDGPVWAVAFFPNSKSIVSGAESGTVCVWSLVGAHVAAQRLSGHIGAVSSVSVSPNGSRFASASTDKAIRLWNAETNQQLAVLKGHTGKVSTIAFSPNSLVLVSGSEDCTTQLWNVATRRPIYQPANRHGEPIYSLCFLPDGQKIATGSGGDIILCKPQTGKNSTLVHSGSERVLSVNPSPDGLSLVSVYGKSVCLSTLPRFMAKAASVVLDGHTETVRSATYSPNSLYIASASDDRTIRIWNANGKLEASPAMAHDNPLAVSAEVSNLVMSDYHELAGHEDMVTSVVVSPDASVIVSGSLDRSVRIWDVQTGTEALPPLLGHGDWIRSVAISSDGRVIASGSVDRTVRLWDRQMGTEIGHPMRSHSEKVNVVAFSPDAQWLASGSDDKKVHIWDVAALQQSKVGPILCGGVVDTIAFSPDGRILVTGCRGGLISFWQSETGQPARKPLETHFICVYSIAFSPGGTHIVSGGWCRPTDGTPACIWNNSTGQQTLALVGHTESVYSTVYSPDGRNIVTGSVDRTVRLWNAATGAPIAILSGHRDVVSSVTCTPDGQAIVSCSTDETIRVWYLSEAPRARVVRDVNAAMALHSATLSNGWLQTPSGGLLLWVPAEYLQHLYKLRGTPRRVVLSVDDGGWHRGESWTSCWLVDT